MTLDVYLTPASTPCRAVLMTAKYLGLDVNQKKVNVMAGDQYKPDFLKKNPQHCVPTLDDNGFYLWESRAIQAYLANTYAPDNSVYPKNPKERAIVDRMLHFDISLYRAAYDYLIPQMLKGQPADPAKLDNFKKMLTLLDGFLAKTTYVAANHITLADFSIFATLTFVEMTNFSYADFPKISNWLQKLKLEVPSHNEINEKPLNEFKKYLESKK